MRKRIPNGMSELTGSTRIRLSQIIDLDLWLDCFVEDAKHYNIGEVSSKTGLQKCLVNGRIVWLLPKQGENPYPDDTTKSEERKLAGSAKLAKPDGQITFTKPDGLRNDVRNYFNYMISTWKDRPVRCPFLNYAQIGLDELSYRHIFESGKKSREPEDVRARAECLPFLRDILQRTGKPAKYSDEGGKESYTIVGRAEINGRKRKVLVVIRKDPEDKFFHLSAFQMK